MEGLKSGLGGWTNPHGIERVNMKHIVPREPKNWALKKREWASLTLSTTALWLHH